MAGKGGCASKLATFAVAVVVLVIAGGVALFMYIDSIAKSAIEVAGTKVLGVQTTVNKVSIGVLSASAGLSTLEIANPDGYQAKKFLQLAKGGVAVNASSLMSNVVHVPKIELSDLTLEFEEKIGGGSNVDVILANVKKFSSGSKSAEEADKGGKQFVIDELTLTNIVVTARASGVPLAAQGVVIKVPKVQLKDIGSGGKDPVGLNQLVGLIVQSVLQAVLDAGGSQLPSVFAQGLANGLGGLGDFFGEGVGTITVDLGAGITKGVDEAAKGAGDAIKQGIEGVFGPKK